MSNISKKSKKNERPYTVHNKVFESLTDQDLHEIEQRAYQIIGEHTTVKSVWIEATCWFLENKKGVKI